jgi:fibronectin-binding autotransporter adhesin
VTVDSVSDYTFTGTGKVDGGAKLIKKNTGNLILLTTNDYLGSTTITGGTVQVGDGTTSGDIGVGNLTNNSVLLFMQPDSRGVAASMSGTGQLIQQGTATLSLLGDNSSFAGPTTISAGSILQVGTGGFSGTLGTGPVTNSGVLNINRNGTLAINSPILAGAAGTEPVIFSGPGTVTLGGGHTYGGNTYISNGVVKLGAAQAIPSGGATTGWLILDGGSAAGTLDLNGHNQTVNALSGLTGASVGRILNNGGTGINTLTINETANTTYNGQIFDNTGSGGKVAVVMAGSSTLTLTPLAPNTFSGGTTISNGTITGANSSTAGANMLGTGPVTFYGSNGIWQLPGYNTGNTSPTYPTESTPVVVPAGQSGTLQTTCRGTFNGAVSGSGTLNLWVFYVRGEQASDWSGFTGALNVFPKTGNDEFRINNAIGLPNARVYLTNGVNLTSDLTAGTVIPIGELTGDSGSYLPIGNGGSAVFWRIGLLNTSTNLSSVIQDNSGIIKDGTGTLKLLGANTYTNGTAVTNGTLALGADQALSPNCTNFDLRSSSAVLDASALTGSTLNLGTVQMLQGIGVVHGSVTCAGTVSPGTTTGGQPIGTLTISGSAVLTGNILMELNVTNANKNDQLAAASIGVTNATLTVTNVGPNITNGTSFTLFNHAVTGTLLATNLTPGTTFVWQDNTAVDGTIKLLSGGVSLVNPTPIRAVFTPLGNGSFTLTWPSDHLGWYIQSNSVGLNSPGSWFNIPNSSSTTTITVTPDPTKGEVFYRMVYTNQ